MGEGNTTGPEFLESRFPPLAGSSEVTTAAERTKKRTGVEVPREPEARIQNYLDRFKEIVERKDLQKKERGIDALKKILTAHYVVRVEDIPDSYWQAQMKVVRNRGQLGDWQDLPEEELLKVKQEHLAQTKEDQKGSLEEWIDYLASDKPAYLPDYLKYWVFQGMLKLERYKRGEEGKPGRFPERPTGRQRSTKMFPEVNERALEFIASAYEAKSKNEPIHFRYDMPQLAQQTFLGVLEKKDFRLLYGWGQEYIPPISEEEMKNTHGQWVTYPEGSEAKTLSRTLQGKGSGWCIAGENIAQDYLKNGDLAIYYTRDREGNFTIPRVVIVSSGNRVTEVRGIEWEENVDKYVKETNIIRDKLNELPGGEQFYETDVDAKRLTAIDRKITSGIELDGSELAFLYEIDRPIKYFGYKKDPRIAELRSKRKPEEDMPAVFGCAKEQIARRVSDIGPNTRAYVGPLEKGIFDKLAGIEHIYTSFPEGKIRIETLEVGGIDFKKLFKELEDKFQIKDELRWDKAQEIIERTRGGSIQISAETTNLLLQLAEKQINISGYALDLLKSPDFTTLNEKQQIILVKARVQDLGFKNGATTAQIIGTEKDTDGFGYQAPFTKGRMTELGLDLCLPEVGIYQRLKDTKQLLGDWYWIAMKQIADRDGLPSVFELVRRGDGLWLDDDWAGPGGRWYPEDRLVVALRKSEPQALKRSGFFDKLFRH